MRTELNVFMLSLYFHTVAWSFKWSFLARGYHIQSVLKRKHLKICLVCSESCICENHRDSAAFKKAKVCILWDSFAIVMELMAEGDLTSCKLAVSAAPEDWPTNVKEWAACWFVPLSRSPWKPTDFIFSSCKTP